MAKTAADFIYEHGADVVAKAAGRDRGVVDVWRYRHRFPRVVWPELQKAFPSLTLDVMLKMERDGRKAFAIEEGKRRAAKPEASAVA